MNLVTPAFMTAKVQIKSLNLDGMVQVNVFALGSIHLELIVDRKMCVNGK